MPSTAGDSVEPKQEEEEEEDEVVDDDEDEEPESDADSAADGDVSMKQEGSSGPGGKKVNAKKEAKRKLDDKVSLPSTSFSPSSGALQDSATRL